MAERRRLRIVHTSDVHLGAYSTPAERSAFDRHSLIEGAFAGVIDLAIRSGADALMIAGDFFDNSRVSKDVVDFARIQLRRFPGPKILLPGNHDPLDDDRLYAREDLEGDVPGLRIVRAHTGESIVYPELDLVVWGRGYYDHDWHFRPLEGLPGRIDGRWHIALAHGHFAEDGDGEHRSLPIRPGEIEAASGWDYLAFGHWESHADVSRGATTAVYSGAPMPLSDANRQAGYAVVVDCNTEGVRWHPERVDPRRHAVK